MSIKNKIQHLRGYIIKLDIDFRLIHKEKISEDEKVELPDGVYRLSDFDIIYDGELVSDKELLNREEFDSQQAGEGE